MRQAKCRDESALDLSVSIVTYKTEPCALKNVVEKLKACKIRNVKIFIVDNSPTDELKPFVGDGSAIEYIYTGSNLGYGRANNIAIRRCIHQSKYHLVMNPDIDFQPDAIEKLYAEMECHDDIGMIAPKVTYADGSIQYLCKLLPTPFDLFARRFVPFKRMVRKRNVNYELRFADYDHPMDVPNLSGCFMLIRTDALSEVGIFDERFFLYLEDVDLCRRINQKFRTVYSPVASIVHGYKKGSYSNRKMLFHHVRSAVRYFNKWGWFVDKNRKDVNNGTVEKLLMEKAARAGEP